LKRKKPCEDIYCNTTNTELLEELRKKKEETGYKCDDCGKAFKDPQGKYQHKLYHCKCKEENLEQKIEELSSIINDLRRQLKTNVPKVQHVTNNNIVINNIRIAPLNFGNENMGALPEGLIGDLFLNLQMTELLKTLHYEQDFPENNNIRLKSIKRRVVEIYENDEWQTVSFVSALNKLVLQGTRIFKDYYRRNKKSVADEMTKEEIENAVKTLNELENLNNTYVKPIHKDLELVLEQQRSYDQPSYLRFIHNDAQSEDE
jgi:DNA-directed RNA polymerase subunit RPC12/RpoP